MLIQQLYINLRGHFVAHRITSARGSENIFWFLLKYWPGLTLINLWCLERRTSYNDFTTNDINILELKFYLVIYYLNFSGSLTKESQQQNILEENLEIYLSMSLSSYLLLESFLQFHLEEV
jgi:hypothetical protein